MTRRILIRMADTPVQPLPSEKLIARGIIKPKPQTTKPDPSTTSG